MGFGAAGAAQLLGCRVAPARAAAPPPPPTSSSANVAVEPVPTAESVPPPAPVAEEPPKPPPPDPSLKLPAREKGALTGSQFLAVAKSKKLGREGFDNAVLAEISTGNVPDFERKLLPITTQDAAGRTATFLVLADYLAVGTDDDFIRAPVTCAAAQTIADLTKTMLPTRFLVDAIYRQAEAKLPPSYIDGGPTDDEIADFKEHHKKLEKARKAKGFALGVLTGGDMKDLVLTNRLEEHPGKVAIYGWHNRDDSVIQSLSTRHECRYADYSHGVRLIDRRVLVDGVEHDLADLMRDPDLSGLVSDEGPLRVVAYAKNLPEYVAGTGKPKSK
ncbi:MAG: hypothetical protein U0414_06785 [Polyangiaceae bacterium]